jgi:hypothetical protein
MQTVLFMNTVHFQENFDAYYEKSRTKRKGIYNFYKELREVSLRIPSFIKEYNDSIGEIN